MNSFNQKKTVYVDKTLRICAIQFWQSCWNVSKKVRNFAPKIYENKRLDFRKSYSTACKFPGKKIAMKKLIKTDETQIWQSVGILLTKYDKILLKFSENFVNIYLLKKLPQ